MKRSALVLHECHSDMAVVRWLETPQGEDQMPAWLQSIGDFVLRGLGKLGKHTVDVHQTVPCYHISVRGLTQEKFEKIERLSWKLDAERLIADVEQGNTQG